MDALSRLLMLNAPQGTIDKNCLLGSDWQLPHAAGELSVIRWHALTQGAAKLEMPAGQTFTLHPGNVVLLPQNSAHRLSHVENESTCIVCGTFRLQRSARYFLTSLPEVLFLAPKSHSVEFRWIREAIPFLQQESRSLMAGADALCSQICAVLFTLAVREWITQANTEKNILSLLLHPRLGSVMQQMLEMPGHNWTVESLASIVHMSRASFAQLFREVSGTTPLAVLTKLRLQIAAQMFSRETLPVVVIAESVGYASESSFHKAFVREFGCTPGEYRESVRQLQEVKHE
ncbi:reactive chlorine-specific transcriptional regulator RclR [Escherichia albertii]|uniref:reactive chlorine-specific transcriptional regulator RclR n=1 Tax=Escherichia albertii TaxID=208962 RepID=UPI00235F8EEF|nr:reactive chlorine-specific transcriptional regulator RclR [Escherichia albertii]MCZ8878156.1 reactive chlorine-specific transcriptional regulator RclR [Escherichia albertii]WDB87428.1 reactive chlorine-specific transcriptional regulator RclR [Escherichia albertii]